jgi:hypothetical protein
MTSPIMRTCSVDTLFDKSILANGMVNLVK